jgi:putative phosphoribosyl transferase
MHPPHDQAPRYDDRRHAGRVLAGLLAEHPLLAAGPPPTVLGLPRGGVVVAAPVADALDCPLDAVVVRKLGVPGRPELAMGAVAAVAGRLEVVWNPVVLTGIKVPDADLDAVLRREVAELRRRDEAYRGGRPPPVLEGAVAVLVDDGLATGATMRAALAAVRRQDPAGVIIAVPVGAPETCRTLAREVDALVCPSTPRPFRAVGQSYADFSPTSDAEVQEALGRQEG